MTTLDGIRLFETGQPTSGGAFLLTGTAKVGLTISLPDGWTADIKTGGRYIVARKPAAIAGYVPSRDAAFRAAQQALDLLSISRTADLGIRDAETEHIIWWPETDGQVLRLTNVVTIGMDLHATVVVRDADGYEVSQPAPAVTWHESLRYFRLAQVTDDLFDAYRNIYLALESLLDRIAPQRVDVAGKMKEGESAWIKRALNVISTRVPLASFAPKGTLNPEADLYNELYVATRTALFHAKRSRPSFRPHAPGKEKETVTAAVERLACLYMTLAEQELGTRSAMGVITYAGFDLMTAGLKEQVQLQVTDNSTVANPETRKMGLSGGIMFDLRTHHTPELEKPGMRCFLGTANAEDIGRLSHLAASVATVNDRLLAAGIIEGKLILAGVSRLESHMALRMRDARQPKVHFAT